MFSSPAQRSAETVSGEAASVGRPLAAIAAARLSRAILLLGACGLASSIFVVSRVVGSWQVTSRAGGHHFSIFGQLVGYPTANLAAIVVVILAALGLAVTVIAVLAAARELADARRFARRIAEQRPIRLRGALIIDDGRPHAFCAGLFRPQVYLSSGAVELLDDLALEVVLAHERKHARRHDPLRLAAGRVLMRALFFLPCFGDLIRRQQTLAEFAADESAIGASAANRSALARAMLSFCDSGLGEGPDGSGIDPARVDCLVGEPPSWRFPAALCAAAGAVIVLLVAVAVLLGRIASGQATLALPVISRQPCVVVLALIPVGLALLMATCRRRVRRDRAVRAD